MKENQNYSNSKKICIVIPTYNEKKNIKKLIHSIQRLIRSFKQSDSATVLVVDDNSPDGTGRIVEELAKLHSTIQVLHRPSKQGIGSAYKEGFHHAIQQIKSDALVQMDADGSHDPKEILNFLKKLEEGHDVVVGSRRISGGKILGWSSYRRITSFVANQLAKKLCGIKVYDATSGYRAFSTKSLQKIGYATVKSDGYAFQIEMLYRFQKKGLKIVEIPIVFVNRKYEKTKFNYKEIFLFLYSCLRILCSRIKMCSDEER